jgi:hypothetical protein
LCGFSEILEGGQDCGTQQKIVFHRPVVSFAVILGHVGQIVSESCEGFLFAEVFFCTPPGWTILTFGVAMIRFRLTIFHFGVVKR